MFSILHTLAAFVADLVKSRSRLEAENLLLRHQLNVAVRKAPARLRLRGCDRAILVWLVRLWPNLLDAVQVVKPSCTGIGQAPERFGAGSRKIGQGDLRLIVTCAI